MGVFLLEVVVLPDLAGVAEVFLPFFEEEDVLIEVDLFKGVFLADLAGPGLAVDPPVEVEGPSLSRHS